MPRSQLTWFSALLLSVACSGASADAPPETGVPSGAADDPASSPTNSPEVDPVTGQPTAPGEPDPIDPAGPIGPAPVPQLPGDQRDVGCDTPTPGPGTLRRLTASEFRATLETLFDGQDVPKGEVLAGTLASGYETRADGLLVQDLGAQTLMDYAGEVAQWAIASKRWRITDCQEHQAACWNKTVEQFGAKVFREPLSAAQQERYVGLFQKSADFESGLQSVVQTMLQSPHFLYRRELGQGTPGDSVTTLTPYEQASSLSYLITGTMPDESLLRMAAEGRLSEAGQLEEQVERLLNSERGKERMTLFVDSWLDLDRVFSQAKNNQDFELTQGLRDAMWEETAQYVSSVYDSGGFKDLFLSDHTFVSTELATFYGLPAISEQGFQRVSLEGSNRIGGLLGQSTFLLGHSNTDYSSPTKRGVLVREQLLCLQLAPPPSNVNTNLPDVSAAKTTRELFEFHKADASCSGCHDLIDPIGFGFEHYDGFGRYRETENGEPIDASGTLIGSADAPSFTGLEELSELLANNDQVRNCLAKNFSEFAFGQPEWEEDACTSREVARIAIDDGDSLKSYVRALTQVPHFTQRRSQQ